ncbi:interleukin-17C-like isoform X2 [Ruditapes philippinarum]|nr:interleukin-17C-like isoform X2 [Ruditapes philippinarum]
MSQETAIFACREPDNLHLEVANALLGLYTDDGFRNFSLNTIPCLKSNDIIRNIPEHYDNREQSHIPTGTCVIPENGGNVITDSERNHGEMCPWNYVIDFDENRYPKRLAKAVCQCEHCHRGSCRPIHSYIPILRKECDLYSGQYVFNKYIEEVPVGCRCIRARRAVQGNVFRHRLFRMME